MVFKSGAKKITTPGVSAAEAFGSLDGHPWKLGSLPTVLLARTPLDGDPFAAQAMGSACVPGGGPPASCDLRRGAGRRPRSRSMYSCKTVAKFRNWVVGGVPCRVEAALTPRPGHPVLGWLLGWLAGCAAGWLALGPSARRAGWLAARRAGWLLGWLDGWLVPPGDRPEVWSSAAPPRRRSTFAGILAGWLVGPMGERGSSREPSPSTSCPGGDASVARVPSVGSWWGAGARRGRACSPAALFGALAGGPSHASYPGDDVGFARRSIVKAGRAPVDGRVLGDRGHRRRGALRG